MGQNLENAKKIGKKNKLDWLIGKIEKSNGQKQLNR